MVSCCGVLLKVRERRSYMYMSSIEGVYPSKLLRLAASLTLIPKAQALNTLPYGCVLHCFRSVRLAKTQGGQCKGARAS